MLNVNRLEYQVILVAPVFLRTLEMEQSAQVCIHRMSSDHKTKHRINYSAGKPA